MAASANKADSEVTRIEMQDSSRRTQCRTDLESGAHADDRTTAKAWLCVFFLAMTFGTPFWGTPTSSNMAAQLLARLGQGELANWVVPTITTGATVTILLFGANSDLFGRRWFLLIANIVNMIGYILCASATNTSMLIAGLGFNGAGSGMAGVALIAAPELLPNKWRHIGVCLADAFIYIEVIIGPVAGRYAILQDDNTWQYVYWAGFIEAAIAFIGLFVFYKPPKHPRGVPWRDALKGLDWIGGVLFTVGAVLVLVGIVYTSYLPASDPRVIASFTVGFVLMVVFALWERYSSVRYKLCPTEIFTSHNGREFAVPFCLTFTIVGFFYGTAVVYPAMLNDLYFDEDTSLSTQLLLSLPANVGLPVGAVLLMAFGRKLGHWRWSMILSNFSLVLWGSLLALITPYNKAMMITFVTLSQVSYGWAAYLSVTFTQLGVPQTMLGLSGGLAGTARYAGGAVASACFATAISNGIKNKGAELIPQAALEHGVPQLAIPDIIAAASSRTELSKIDGVSDSTISAIRLAYKYAASFGIRNAALASLAFGVVGIGLSLFVEDIGPKMTEKIETFLENDELAEKNKFH